MAQFEPVNVVQKFSLFDDLWSPRLVGELNGQHVKLAKLKGEFIWHKHDEEDELFFVIKGTLKIRFKEAETVINEGEFLIVPRGTEHKPIADEEVWVMLFEPASTINTGDRVSERTKRNINKI